MRAGQKFAVLLAKTGVLAVFIFYLANNFLREFTPPLILKHVWLFSAILSFFIFCLDGIVLYPYFRNPLRHLPTVEQHGDEESKIISESPRGKTPLSWIIKYPDADMIHIRGGFNVSRLVPVSPRALRDVLSTNTYDFEKPSGVRAFLARIIGYGLILSEGGPHKKQRKALTPAFNVKKIRELYSLMWEKTHVLLDQIDKDIANHPAAAKYGEKEAGKGLVEMSEWASRLTLDIIGPTAMGRDFQSLTTEENPIAKSFLEILEPSPSRILFLGLYFVLPPWLIALIPGPINRMINRNQKFLRGLCHDIIDEKKFELLRQKDSASHDILSTIMKTNEFTDSELVDQMLTFLAAGHETTASALTWCCWLLATNPDIQTKLRAEIRENIPSSTSSITWDLLESLPYLNGVCEETQRLFPTVPTTVRESICDTTVAGVTVPKGTILIIVPYAVNRAPSAWGPNADQMIPERWIDTLPDGTQRPNKNGGAPSNFSEITFLHGPRACIGRDFAKAELRCAVAGVVGKFNIELEDPNEKLTIAGVVTTKPVEGMKLKMKDLGGW